MVDLERLYGLLTCPGCGTSPQPGTANCTGCGRLAAMIGGGLDLLDEESKAAADLFVESYSALRVREGWADWSGREDPDGGQRRLWKGRLRSVSAAAAVLARERPSGSRPVVADIGSGGGWAARLIPFADVLAFDLLEVSPISASLTIRADMRKLPVRSATLDAVLYAASLHYSPVDAAVSEAARVLRLRGLMVAVDSPIYKDAESQARAASRTATYYTRAGYPALSDHYHPIDAQKLRAALVDSGFEISLLSFQGSAAGLWHRLVHRPPFSIVVARRYA